MSNILYDLSNNILYDFLDLYSLKEDNFYIFNKSIFKQYEFNNINHNIIDDFYKNLKKFYYPKKIFYLERPINYNNLITIIRQICKKNNIKYLKKIKYDKSNYNIVYYFEII
tara:strand:- start:617 stop:952 length:336 start_codon:yes stop_codon:yes gene_type:complete